MPIASEDEINEFLIKCRETISKSFYFSHKREENKSTVLSLEFTKGNIKETIRSLTIENYSGGPLQDRVYKDKIWIFGKEINGKEIYIKLQLSKYNDPGDLEQTLYCISFHFSKHTLDYPYKN